MSISTRNDGTMNSAKLSSLPTELLRQIINHLTPSHRAHWTVSFQFDPSRDYGRNKSWVRDLQSLALTSKRFLDIARAELFKIVMVRDHLNMDEFVNHAAVLSRGTIAIHVRVLVFSFALMKEQKRVEGQGVKWRNETWEGSVTLSPFGKKYIDTVKSIIRATSQRLTSVSAIVYRPKSELKPFMDYYSFTDMMSVCLNEIRTPALRCLGTCGPRLSTAAREDIVRQLPRKVQWPPMRPPPDDEDDNTVQKSPPRRTWSEDKAKSTWLFHSNLKGLQHIEYREDYYAKFYAKSRGSVRQILESYYPAEVLSNIKSARIILRATQPQDNRHLDLTFLNNSHKLTTLGLDSVYNIHGDSLSKLLPNITGLKTLTISHVFLDGTMDKWDGVFDKCREYLRELVTFKCDFASYARLLFTFWGHGRLHLVSPYMEDRVALEGLFEDVYKRRQKLGMDISQTDRIARVHDTVS